ncbi:hypothetical protein BaRGS_00016284 [Batillaria attramentaria]|uniref:Uncharacterized protein n=1 Tax=Batillaria attramentaria TaxID=370345 RepID=A0ABD0KZH0_9CAEN
MWAGQLERTAYALEGAVGLLQCPDFVYGSSGKVTWSKQALEITKLGPRLSVNPRSGALRIHRAQFQDSGRYTCTVRENNVTKTRDTILSVVSYPKITLVQNASVPRGSEATLLCKVESTPASIITWKRHDVPLEQAAVSTYTRLVILPPCHFTNAPYPGQRLALQEEEIPGAVAHTSASEGIPSVTVSELRFRSVQPAQAGLYLCLAANTPGTARATLALHVTYAPVAVVTVPRVVAWSGHVPPMNIKFKANPSPRISCNHSNQNAIASDFWDLTVEPIDEEVVNVTITVLPEMTQQTVYGTFTCTATNSAGEATAAVELIGGRLPSPPTVRVDSHRPTWIVLELRMPADMGLPSADRIIARYEDMTSTSEIVEFDKAVTPEASNTTQRWNLTGLVPGHEYRLTLQLSNSIASSNATVLNTVLPLKAVPDPVQFLSAPQGDQPRHYVLQWRPPTTYGANITGYTLRYRPVIVAASTDGLREIGVAGPESRVHVRKSVKQVVISSLKENTYYRLSMVAHSDLGASQPATFLFRTANNTDPSPPRHDSRDRTSIHYSRQTPQSPVVLEGEGALHNASPAHITSITHIIWTVLAAVVYTAR